MMIPLQCRRILVHLLASSSLNTAFILPSSTTTTKSANNPIGISRIPTTTTTITPRQNHSRHRHRQRFPSPRLFSKRKKDDDGDDDDNEGDLMMDFLMKQLGGNTGITVIGGPNGSTTIPVNDPNDGDDNDESDASYSDISEDCLEALRSFDLKPKEVVEYLDRFVIQQYDAKKVLAVAICDHYNHCRRCLVEQEEKGNDHEKRGSIEELFRTSSESTRTEYAKPNVLLCGPTGVGKTYLLKCLARLVGVPFVKADATKFSETGIVGRDAEDLVRDLVDAAGGNTTLASMGIIYVDEVDKIAGGGGGDDAMTTKGSFNTKGVQNNFLKLLEDTDVGLDRPGEMQFNLPAALGGPDGGDEPSSINTRNILFIFSGAFTNLDKDLRMKREKKPFGIEIDAVRPAPTPTTTPNGEGGGGGSGGMDDDINRPAGKGQSYLRYAETSDFIRAGLEPEFVGRVPVRVALNSLTSSDLLQILTSAEGSVLHQFTRDFNGYGITMDTSDKEALNEIALKAEEEGTGARGLVTVLEKTLREHKFELPSSSIDKFKLNVETVLKPTTALYQLLDTETAGDGAGVCLEDLKRWERKLHRSLPENVRVWLTEETQNYLIIESLEADMSAYSLAGQRFGTTLGRVVGRVHELTGQTAFPISMEIAKDPEMELRKWLGMLEDLDVDVDADGS